MIALALAAAVATTDQSREILSVGVGAHSCASWLATPDSRFEGNVWVYGYWTGLNQGGSNPYVGRSTDGPGIVAEVRKLCEATPSATVIATAYRVYITLRREGR